MPRLVLSYIFSADGQGYLDWALLLQSCYCLFEPLPLHRALGVMMLGHRLGREFRVRSPNGSSLTFGSLSILGTLKFAREPAYLLDAT